MSAAARLLLPRPVYDTLLQHLLPARPKAEEAAFVFAHFDRGVFRFVEWYPVPVEEFEHRSLYHLELNDSCRAKTIKRAHDLGCSVLEFHSHPISWIAGFSFSDCEGFEEYVPHVFWRLKGKPYAAIVVTPHGFDSLLWLSSPSSQAGTVEIVVGDKVFSPSGLTFAGGCTDAPSEI